MGRAGRRFGQVPRVAVLAVAAGCRAAGGEQTPVVFAQTPPTIQAAYNDDHRGAVIHGITRTTRGGEDYYTVQYSAVDGSKHDVVYNEAGDEIDKH
jgi:hypothetical protein